MSTIATSVILCTWIGLFAAFLIPLAGVIYLRCKGYRPGKGFLWGILAYLLAMGVVRSILVLLVLPGLPVYTRIQNNPWAMGLIMGITTALLTGFARLIVLTNFTKGILQDTDGVAMGLGDGWLNAIFTVCVGLITNLVVFGAINNGNYNHMEPEQIAEMLASAQAVTWASPLVAGLEQVMNAALQAAVTLLMLVGIREGKTSRGFLESVGAHAFLECLLYILPAFLSMPDPVRLCIRLVLTAPVVYYVFRLRRKAVQHG